MQLRLESPSILIYSRPVDFRKSIDGLVEVILSEPGMDPCSSVFVFYNRSRDRVKILAWHKNGFVLLLKRLEKGRFFVTREQSDSVTATPQQLGWLLAGLDWVTMSQWGELEYQDFQ
jgi:transposase